MVWELNYWSGWKPGTGNVDGQSAWRRDAAGNVIVDTTTRVPNLFYLNAVDRSQVTGIRWTFKNANADVAGNPNWNPKGTSAMHTVWDGDITKCKCKITWVCNFYCSRKHGIMEMLH